MGNLPKNWVLSNIEDSIDILDYMRKPVSASERAKRIGDIPYYGATGIAGKIDDYLFDEELVLLGEDGAPFLDYSKNVAYIISGKSWVNNHAHVLKAKKRITSNTFLLHYLNQFDYTDYVGGTTRLKLNQGNLKSIPFPLPPLAEQQRIVAKLDGLFGHLDSLKQRLKHIPTLLKQFRQSVLTQAVTGKLTEEWREGKELGEWEEDILGNIILGTPKNGAYYHRSLYGSGTRIIRIDCFYDGVLKNWDVVQLVEIPESDKAIYGLVINDILINRVNSIEYLGKCMLVDSLPEDCIYESNMMRITCNTEIILPKYLKNYLISHNGLTELRKNAKHSVNQASINQQDVKSVIVNYPPKQEQTEIVRRVEALFTKADTIEAAYQNLKQQIDSLPQAILAKAFKGELVEQLPTDGNAKDLLKEIAALRASLEKEKKSKKKNKINN